MYQFGTLHAGGFTTGPKLARIVLGARAASQSHLPVGPVQAFSESIASWAAVRGAGGPAS